MIKRSFRVVFVHISGEVEKLHKTGSAIYFLWKAEDVDKIAKRASGKLQDFVKGAKYNYAAIMVHAEVRGFKFWKEVGVVDENGWREDVSFSSNNI